MRVEFNKKLLCKGFWGFTLMADLPLVKLSVELLYYKA